MALLVSLGLTVEGRVAALVEPRLLMDVAKGPDDSAAFHLGKTLAALGSQVYFTAAPNSFTSLLLQSDGTLDGTRVLSESAQVIAGTVFGPHQLILTGHPGQELIRIDDDLPGIEVLGDYTTIHSTLLSEYEDHVYFSCRTLDVFYGLCRSDGTAEGTTLEALTGDGTGPIVHFAPTGGALYFVTRQSSGFRHFLWKKASPASAPTLLLEFGHCDFFSWPGKAVRFDELLLLPCGASAASFATALSVLDPSSDELDELAAPDSWASVSQALAPVAASDRVLLLAPSGAHEDRGLFAVDASSITEIGIPALEAATLLTPVSDARAAFMNYRSDGIDELWMTDGTVVGTVLVSEFQADSEFTQFQRSYPTDFDHLFFKVYFQAQGLTELWYVSDVDGIAARPIASLPLGGEFFVPVGRNLVGFAGFEDFGVEPAVLELKSRIGGVFSDGFE